MSRPAEILAGDTYTWTVSSSDYPATAWTLKVTFVNAVDYLQITATASGSDYAVTLSSTNSATLAAGTYKIVEAVYQGTGESALRHTLYEGTIVVKANAAGAAAATDMRTTARKMLDAIEVVILANVSKGYNQMALAARSIGYRSWDEMMRARARLKAEVDAEERAEKIAAGLDPGKRIHVRFDSIS